MRVLKFSLSGKTAFFKKPDVNTYLYFTYGQIHKIALLGIIGATIGLKGYGQQTAKDAFPEFYDRLQHLKVAIRPESEKGYFSKKVQTYNNSVGYASKEQGGNLIVKEQWLECPKWTIFIMLDNHQDGQLIEQHFMSKQFIYYPYLGRNDHFATISEIELIEVKKATEVNQIDTLFRKTESIHLKNEIELFDDVVGWKYEEFLPTSLDKETNLYVSEAFIFTNMSIEAKDVEEFYKYKDQILYFI